MIYDRLHSDSKFQNECMSHLTEYAKKVGQKNDFFFLMLEYCLALCLKFILRSS